MGSISVGPAISAGFRLIGREPLAFLVWCGIYFAISAGMTLATWPETSRYYEALSNGDTDAQAPFGALQWLSLPVFLVMAGSMTAAVMRAVIQPDDRRFFYLRLGSRELWMVLCWIVLFLLWAVAYIASMLAMVAAFGVVGVGAGADGENVAAGSMIAVGLLILVALPVMLALWIWLWVRFSMAPTMCFAENRLRVWASWRLTKGHALRIFLVALVLFVVTSLVILILLGGSAAALAGAIEAASLPAFFAQISRASIVAQLVYNAVASIVVVAMSVIGAASWAEMYRQLRPASVADAFN